MNTQALLIDTRYALAQLKRAEIQRAIDALERIEAALADDEDAGEVFDRRWTAGTDCVTDVGRQDLVERLRHS